MIHDQIDTVDALFDPKYKGKIGMPEDPQELGSIGLNAIGVHPADSTFDDWKRAADKLKEQKPLVHAYKGQPYITDLKNGDTVISWCWSGDIFQANLNSKYRDLKLVFAKEGAMFWTDNMCIPVGVENPVSAMTFMDYVYDPHVQALIEDYNAYVCPVPAAKSIIANDLKDPAVANSPTVFPDEQQVALSKPYYQFKGSQDLDQWNKTFEPIFTG